MMGGAILLLVAFLGGLGFAFVVPPLLARWVDDIRPQRGALQVAGALGALVAVGAWMALVSGLLYLVRELTEQTSPFVALAVFAGMVVSGLLPRRKKRFDLSHCPAPHPEH